MNNILNQEIINKKKKKYSSQWSVTSDEYNKKGIYLKLFMGLCQ